VSDSPLSTRGGRPVRAIAEIAISANYEGMSRHVGLIAATIVCGCHASPPATQEERTQAREAPRLPFDKSTGFLNGYRLRVPRQGDMTWNGQPVDDARLRTYLSQYATPRVGDPLFVEFEPGVPRAVADRVRQQIIDSGLCNQRRCAEVGWNVPRPVVN
jgi:hypothetical protein